MTGIRCPYAILTACSQSHGFEERRFTVPSSEEEAVKIGRSVARWKPSADNAIFDCKVLSRNHAVLWHEEGFFLLKDTKSSNGTFVNNDRLSKSAEESVPRQIYSGDILQFGVEIVENANKVTHGCIVAMIRLYDANGDEVCHPDNEELGSYSRAQDSESSMMFPVIDSNQLFQLQHYLREALFRERSLEQKLAMLENVLSSTEQAAETSWQALISEDQLLSRIEMLEAQLALYSKNAFNGKVKEQMRELLADKNKFESRAKESLRRAQEERCEALQRLADVERSLLNAEEESLVLRQQISDLESEFTFEVDTNRSLREQISQLEKQLRATGQKCRSSETNDTQEGIEASSLVFPNSSLGENGNAKLYFCNERNRGMLTVKPVQCGFDDEFPALLLCALPLLLVAYTMYSVGVLAVSSFYNKIKRE